MASRGKVFEKLDFKLGMYLYIKWTETIKAGMRKLKNTAVRNDGVLLSGLQRNALASLVHFVVCKVN